MKDIEIKELFRNTADYDGKEVVVRALFFTILVTAEEHAQAYEQDDVNNQNDKVDGFKAALTYRFGKTHLCIHFCLLS